MLRAIVICTLLPLYSLLAGPPLLLYTMISRNPDPLYLGRPFRGIVYLIRLVGVKNTNRRPRAYSRWCVSLRGQSHEFGGRAAVVGAVPRRVAILLKESLFKWPIAGQAFTLAGFIPREAQRDRIGDREC